LVESHEVFINMDGQLSLKIGKGDIAYINTDFLLRSGNIVAKIKTPLNYNYAILLFAVLGLLGLLFAILLKREDKKSGYGLELPSNQKAKKTK
jgi:hypothetical protein